MTDNSAILLISAPDKEGIVFSITEYIYRNRGNILHAEQHIDSYNNIFFMRIEWDLSNFKIPKNEILTSLNKIKEEWQMDLNLFFKGDPLKAAIFVSKTDHCLYDLLLRCKSHELNLDVSLIISNHETTRVVAESFDVPFYFFPVFKETKAETEFAQKSLLKELGVELIVLARYMQILSPGFVKDYQGKIINVHHSFLPAFIGANPYRQAFERGVKIIGSTAHYVTEDLDDGPIIEQKVVRVSHKHDLNEFIVKGKDLEKQVLSYAVKKHVDRKVLVFQNKTVVFD